MFSSLFGDQPKYERKVWGQRLKYEAYHVPEAELDGMRHVVDDLCDRCLAVLTVRGESVDAFLGRLGEARPPGGGDEHPDVQAFLMSVYTVPAYVDWAAIHDGQLCFLKHPGPAAFGLLYYSLIGGFSAPKIVKTLDATAYMTTQNYDRTWRRLNETFEMVVDCLEDPDGLQPGRAGWKSVLRVRFLHSRVRLGILSRDTPWDAAQYGLPINQEDMVGTLLSFSTNVVETIQRMTGRLTRADEEAYLHLWRYIGHLIGVREEFNPLASIERARGTTESIVMHLLHPDRRSGEVARNVLRAVSGREQGRMRWSYAAHSEMARLLLGHPLADALGLETSLIHRLHANLVWALIYVLSNIFGPFIGPRQVAAVKKALRFHLNRALQKHAKDV